MTIQEDKKTCSNCNGLGYTSEHGCNGTVEDCGQNCPIQVECEMCNVIGEIKP